MKDKRPARPDRIPELDGFRVLLVFIVSWYHIWQQSWLGPHFGRVSLDFLVRSGYMPVDGTILLSGFLLFLPYAKSMFQRTPLPDRRRFYEKRAMRILPSYYFLLAAVLLVVVIPFGLYSTAQFAVKDIFTHLTFTFMFSAETYMGTQLGAACWTLALEMQAYLLFPFVARWVMRRPAAVLTAMVVAAFCWRGYCIWALPEYAMVVNQLPSFLDVYALGMVCAMLYVKLTSNPPRRPWLRTIIATAVLAVSVLGIIALLKDQAREPHYVMIQRGQMLRRFPFAVLLSGVVMSLPFAVQPVRFLMGNRVMGFLAGISMNYYLIHQIVAVHLKRLGIPYSASATPHMDGDRPWQWAYTLLSFGVSLVLATLVTYLVEKPGARAMNRLFRRREKERSECFRQQAEEAVATLQLRPGETVLVEGFGARSELMAALVEVISAAKAIPQVQLRDAKIDKALLSGQEQATIQAAEAAQLTAYQAYIGVGEVPDARIGQCEAGVIRYMLIR